MAKRKSQNEGTEKKARSRKSTRPRPSTRQSTRQIAQSKTRASRREREPSRTQNRRRNAKPNSLRKKARSVVLLMAIALFGFLGVIIADTLSRAHQTFENVALVEMWDKLVDRFLDNDVPRQGGSKKRKNIPKKVQTPKIPAKKTAKKTSLPTLKAVPSTRADLQAPTPTAYAKATQGAVELQRAESERDARQRLDRIISGANLD